MEELLSHGEATVATPAQRQALEDLFARSGRSRKISSRLPGGKRKSEKQHVPADAAVVPLFEAGPQAKEFVFLIRPAVARRRPPGVEVMAVGELHRMYVEVREGHLRLATTL